MNSMGVLDYYSFVKTMIDGASIVIDGGEYTYNVDGYVEYTSYCTGSSMRLHIGLSDLHIYYTNNQESLCQNAGKSVRYV